ncbi:hypothetical protein EmuJ_000794500 [Echinococcus multilocularis]|uniref:Uncharacterized protein n=1 Tax=Echinococcus multilocularis TaxID=6211 RepID=A0A068Y766_ECHMU|nr:hypothetical protein EmuJ_000794500 [Echinococcus multilocularis]
MVEWKRPINFFRWPSYNPSTQGLERALLKIRPPAAANEQGIPCEDRSCGVEHVPEVLQHSKWMLPQSRTSPAFTRPSAHVPHESEMTLLQVGANISFRAPEPVTWSAARAC